VPPSASPVIRIVTVAALSYAFLVALLWLLQSRFIYYPGTGREIVTTPSAHGAPFEDLTLETSDGERLNAWWISAESPRGAVLLLHGNAGNISHRIGYALMFRRLGYSTLLLDYRGYGKSTGSPTEQGTYVDAERAWRWLTITRRIPEQDVVVFGESLGGGVASWLAARHQVRAVVLASTFTSAVDLGAELYPFLPVRLATRFRYDTLARVPDLRVPLLVVHSREDEIIPFSHGRRLFEAAREPKEMLELTGGHNEGLVFAREDWVKALAAFLAATERTAAD
jgi:fermentation-respiration switch protein FrsA (DUF1100 family)